MKTKKMLFPIVLISAICLTCIGIVSVSKTFASPTTNSNKVFSVYTDYAQTSNITIIDSNNTYYSYLLDLNESTREYTLSFDVINNGDFDAKFMYATIDEIPVELKDILSYEIINKKELNIGDMDNVVIKYQLKDNLNAREKEVVNKYKGLKVNLIMNYNQA